MMNIDGACLCGTITYEAEVNPKQVFLCHCNDCQTQSGTAFRSVVRVVPESFQQKTGELAVFTKQAESGALRDLAFCPRCGTSIYGSPGGGADGFLSLRVGTVRQRKSLAPVAHVWWRSSQSWITELNDLPRIETQPGAPTS